MSLSAAASARADLSTDWEQRIPVGSSFETGLRASVVDAAGVTYVTATTGPSSNTDILTAAIGPDGAVLWTQTFNGPGDWHDQARGIAVRDGRVLVTGNTPSASKVARVLVVEYDAATGAQTNFVSWSSGPSTSEHGASVAVDAQGDVYVVGGTVGDAADALIVKFDAHLAFQWKRTWDGPAQAPYSQDHGLQAALDPSGDLLVLVHGVMGSLHPDFVVLKVAPDGTQRWQATWGVSGEDSPTELAVDAAGDVYVTGIGIDVFDKYSTLKLSGADGALVWQAYDWLAFRNHPRGLALDGQGNVLVTGSTDPDGDQSNGNDDFYTVKRRADDGALVWTHRYGASCVGCFDAPGDVVADVAGRVLLTGGTSSPPYQSDALTLVLDGATGAELERGVVLGGTNEAVGGAFVALDAFQRVHVSGGAADVNTGARSILAFQYPAWAPLVSTYCVGAPNSNGGGAAIGATGTTSLSENDFTLTVTGAAVQQFGLFFYGPGTTQVPLGDGFLCVQGQLFRLNPPQTTDATGAATRLVDFTQPPAGSGPGQVFAGATWHFQFWYRDPQAGGATYNLSDALTATFVP